MIPHIFYGRHLTSSNSYLLFFGAAFSAFHSRFFAFEDGFMKTKIRFGKKSFVQVGLQILDKIKSKIKMRK